MNKDIWQVLHYALTSDKEITKTDILEIMDNMIQADDFEQPLIDFMNDNNIEFFNEFDCVTEKVNDFLGRATIK